MSADAWQMCPRCRADRSGVAAAAARAATAAYGTLPLPEFDALRAKADELAAAVDNAEPTFREDYEIYGAETGTVSVSYRGACTVCKLELKFTHEHDLPVNR